MATKLRTFSRSANFFGLAIFIGIIVVWQILVSNNVVHIDYVPGIFGVFKGIKELLHNHLLWPALGHTVKCMLIGWLIALVVGGGVGLLIGTSVGARDWTGSTIDIMRSLPSLAFIPVAILIWGATTEAEIVVVAYAATWPMLINTAGGARNIGPRLRDVAKSMQLTRIQRVTKVMLPATGISMLVGARLSLAVSLTVAVVAEVLGLPNGIGYGIVSEEAAGQADRLWAYIVLIGVLGIIANAALIAFNRMAFPGLARLADGNSR